MCERINKAYTQNLLSMQQMVTRYLHRLERLSGKHEEGEVTEEWLHLFGAKETPLSVLQKLVSMQKTTYELLQKAESAQKIKATAPEISSLKQEDWHILELALKAHKEKEKAQDAPKVR